MGRMERFAVRWMLLAWTPVFASSKEVISLPGYGSPPTTHFSGFVQVDPSTDTNLFYYLVESQAAPSSDPLLWWMNGGPGASSLAGLFAENGPLLLNEAGQLMNNPYAWNRNANLLYVEFGPGVGFSYCSNSSKAVQASSCPQSSGDCSPCPISDMLVAEQNVVFIETLLSNVFPALKGRPLYLAGESYAGVYIPTLAAAIIEHFQDTSVVNLYGLWVTDPCTDNRAQFGWLDLGVEFCYQKGLISKAIYETLTDPRHGCSGGRTPVGDLIRKVETVTCKGAWRLYDLATAGLGDAVHPPQVPGLPMYIDPLNAYGPSGGTNIEGYLSRPDVRAALNAVQSPNTVYHLELGNNGYSNYDLQYSACNLAARDGGKSMLDIYQALVHARNSSLAASGLRRIIISAGDIDPVVAMHGTEAAVHAIGLPLAIGGNRRPWFYNATATDIQVLASKPVQWGPSLRASNAGIQFGGFITNFNTSIPGLAFDFITVRGSGHMVPAYAPQQSLHVIEAALLKNNLLSPPLPAGWDTASNEQFYGWKKKTGGDFTSWVRHAMSAPAIVGSLDQSVVYM